MADNDEMLFGHGAAATPSHTWQQPSFSDVSQERMTSNATQQGVWNADESLNADGSWSGAISSWRAPEHYAGEPNVHGATMSTLHSPHIAIAQGPSPMFHIAQENYMVSRADGHVPCPIPPGSFWTGSPNGSVAQRHPSIHPAMGQSNPLHHSHSAIMPSAWNRDTPSRALPHVPMWLGGEQGWSDNKTAVSGNTDPQSSVRFSASQFSAASTWVGKEKDEGNVQRVDFSSMGVSGVSAYSEQWGEQQPFFNSMNVESSEVWKSGDYFVSGVSAQSSAAAGRHSALGVARNDTMYALYADHPETKRTHVLAEPCGANPLVFPPPSGSCSESGSRSESLLSASVSKSKIKGSGGVASGGYGVLAGPSRASYDSGQLHTATGSSLPYSWFADHAGTAACQVTPQLPQSQAITQSAVPIEFSDIFGRTIKSKATPTSDHDSRALTAATAATCIPSDRKETIEMIKGSSFERSAAHGGGAAATYHAVDGKTVSKHSSLPPVSEKVPFSTPQESVPPQVIVPILAERIPAEPDASKLGKINRRRGQKAEVKKETGPPALGKRSRKEVLGNTDAGSGDPNCRAGARRDRHHALEKVRRNETRELQQQLKELVGLGSATSGLGSHRRHPGPAEADDTRNEATQYEILKQAAALIMSRQGDAVLPPCRGCGKCSKCNDAVLSLMRGGGGADPPLPVQTPLTAQIDTAVPTPSAQVRGSTNIPSPAQTPSTSQSDRVVAAFMRAATVPAAGGGGVKEPVPAMAPTPPAGGVLEATPVAAAPAAHKELGPFVAEMAPVLIVKVGPAARGWRIEHVNSGCRQALGLEKEELLGRGLAEMLHADDCAAAVAEMDAAVAAEARRAQALVAVSSNSASNPASGNIDGGGGGGPSAERPMGMTDAEQREGGCAAAAEMAMCGELRAWRCRLRVGWEGLRYWPFVLRARAVDGSVVLSADHQAPPAQPVS